MIAMQNDLYKIMFCDRYCIAIQFYVCESGFDHNCFKTAMMTQ